MSTRRTNLPGSQPGNRELRLPPRSRGCGRGRGSAAVAGVPVMGHDPVSLGDVARASVPRSLSQLSFAKLDALFLARTKGMGGGGDV